MPIDPPAANDAKRADLQDASHCAADATADPIDYATLSPLDVRKSMDELGLLTSPVAAQVEHHDRQIAGPGGALTLRVYRPKSSSDTSEPRGALVFFHGGGFIAGTLDQSNALCQQLAHDAQCVVCSVDYRLAPEHVFPAAVDDCYFATAWVHENADELGVDHKRIAVGGESAGGNLAAVVARLAKERRNPALVLQLLLYPVTDLRAFDTPSYWQNATGRGLTRDEMIWSSGHYLRSDADRTDPRASPLAAKNLIGVPPALVITAEHDPLRDEGEAYAQALRLAHNPVTSHCYNGMLHGFVGLHLQLPEARAALDECTRALRAALNAP